ncbi:MAG: CPBP family intramembrane metalloprotease [Anaerolineae bacterium]|nr:CPBP family intramembrane metalloprotease [Anaerolineae bacterium]
MNPQKLGSEMGNRKSLVAESSDQPSTWVDLAIYLVVGVGASFTMYLAVAISSFAGEWTMLHSSIVWSLRSTCLLGAVYILGVRRGRITWSGIGLVSAPWRWRWFLVGSFVIAIAIPIRTLLANWVRERVVWNPFEMGDKGLSATSLVTGGSYSFSWGKFGLAVLGLGVLVPVTEELYFRGLLHSWFQSRIGFGPRIVLSSLIFGLWHLPAIGSAVSNLVNGLILTVAYERSRSIWLPIALHMIHNVLLVVLIYSALAIRGIISP